MSQFRVRVIVTAVAVCAAAVWHPQAQEGPTGPAMEQAPFDLVLATNGLPAEGRWKSTPVVVDINRDGLMDLIVHPRLGKHTGVWFGDGKGNWTDASEGLTVPRNTTCGGSTEVGDINHDGNLDLAVADHCDGVFVFLGDGKGHWQNVVKSMNPAEAKKHEEDGENPFTGSEALAMGDINGDGQLDLVVAGSDRGGFTIYLGDGSGTNWKEQPPSGLPTTDDPGEGEADGGGWSREVLLVDMNGDKHLDVVSSYHRGPRVWLGDGKGKFKRASEGLPSPLMYGVFQQIGVVDLNGDKRPDVIAANTVNGPEAYVQKADGSWEILPDVMPPMRGGATAIAAGDLDGDGRVDLVTGGRVSKSGQYGIFVLRNDGHGGWTPLKTPMAEDGQQVVWGLAVSDVNGDKRPDIVATLGGAMGAGGQPAGKPGSDPDSAGIQPHIQVWLNEVK